MRNELSEINPQQTKAIEYYTNPNSETFGILRSSLLKAGYSKSYVACFQPKKHKWLSPVLKNNVKRIKRAEKKLDDILSVQIDLASADKLGLDKIKLQADVSKFIAKHLASGKYKSNDNGDVSSKGDTNITIINYNDTDDVSSDEVIDVEVE